jgi:hypothetical protein
MIFKLTQEIFISFFFDTLSSISYDFKSSHNTILFTVNIRQHLHRDQQDVQIEICAILNDTTGTLMSCAWKNHNCKIGAILGK